MFLYTIFILLLVTFGSIHIAESIRNDTLHPKRMVDVNMIFAIEILFFIGFHILMMKFVPELLTNFPDDRCISACYVYIAINIGVHLLRFKKENRKVEHSRCGYFLLPWMAGLALYSILFVLALQDWSTAYDWLVRAEIAYFVCNAGYFLFIFFTEKETMSTTWRAEAIAMDAVAEKESQPLSVQAMYKEEKENFFGTGTQAFNGLQKRQNHDRKTVHRVMIIMLIAGTVVISWVWYLSENYRAGKYTQEPVVHEEIALNSIIQGKDMEESILNCMSEKISRLLHGRFPDVDESVLETIEPILAEKATRIKRLAYYDVIEATTKDYEKYNVKISLTSANIFQTLQNNFEEVCDEKTDLELSEGTAQMYKDIVEESIQRSIDENTYGEEQIIETIIIVSDKKYQIDASEWKRIFEAILPQ